MLKTLAVYFKYLKERVILLYRRQFRATISIIDKFIVDARVSTDRRDAQNRQNHPFQDLDCQIKGSPKHRRSNWKNSKVICVKLKRVR